MLLYHYCNLNTFIEILKSHKVRFCDITKSNDRLETLYFLDCLEKYLKKTDSVILRSKQVRIIWENILSQYNYYCFCLSSNGDLLSQWRGYARSGGVSIGFDKKELKKYSNSIKSINQPSNHSDLHHYKPNNPIQVKYYDQQNIEKKVFEQQDFQNHFTEEDFYYIIDHLPMFKHPSFKEEKEYRIYFGNYLSDRNQATPWVEFDGKMIDLQFLLSESEIKFFYEIPFPVSALREIIIGPNCNLSEFEIMTLLSKFFGNDPDFPPSFVATLSVQKSKCPFQ